MHHSVVASVTATCQTRALEKWVVTLESLQDLLHDIYSFEVKNVWSPTSNLRGILLN